MSSTRRAQPGTPPRQERYASSEEFERGLNGYLVARRCGILESATDRELIYFLQLLSHRSGGLEKVAADLLLMFPDWIGTRSMHRFGMKPAQIYDLEQCRAVLSEMPWEVAGEFPLQGDQRVGDIAELANESWADDESDTRPCKYPAAQLLKACRNAAKTLAESLEAICLDPARTIEDGTWFFPDLAKAVESYLAHFVAESKSRTVVTALGEKLTDALDYAQKTRSMVLVEGLARMGKTYCAEAWAEQHPGCARYVQVPSTNDDGSFFRAIAKALGLSTGLSWKAVQLRDRIEETLQTGHLLLVLDESHFLWPTSNSRFAFPSRITWIMTALVNKGVPIALISTDQFIRAQKAMEAQTYWRAEQFTGRIGHYEKLPGSLSNADLAKVAQSILPEGDEKSIELLVCYAQGSSKYLAGITSIVRRARYLADKQNRKRVTLADLKCATQESVIPSDTALASALAEPLKRSRKPLASAMQDSFRTDRDSVQAAPKRAINFADRESANESVRRHSAPQIERAFIPG